MFAADSSSGCASVHAFLMNEGIELSSRNPNSSFASRMILASSPFFKASISAKTHWSRAARGEKGEGEHKDGRLNGHGKLYREDGKTV